MADETRDERAGEESKPARTEVSGRGTASDAGPSSDGAAATEPAAAGCPEPTGSRWRRWLPAGIAAAVAIVVTAGVATLLVNIYERKAEGRNPFFRVVDLDETTDDPALWGKNFPYQYDLYVRTTDQVRTRFGGSEALPRSPTSDDPRRVVSQARIEDDPRLKTMWAGYAFAVDFREERGHAYMLDDQTFTRRQSASPQPGTCLHCHASVWVPYRRLGDGDVVRGFEKMNPMPFAEARKLVERPISCIDCHDPATMQLRVTRPGFLEGIRALKASQGVEGYDVNRDATRQEMRAFVCGQCHVEYYFQGPEKRLTYPWHKGLRVEQIYEYYSEVGHGDWEHALSGATVLKAQHPEFELWNQGIHARSGVACADCHMPYRRVGAQKISDHHVRSPVLNIDRACRTCHHFDEAELRSRVETLQERTYGLRNRALDVVVALIGDLAAARAAGFGSELLAPAQELQRRAQFYTDFIEAENSMGFHAAAEAGRILAEAIDYARQGQLLLRALGAPPAVPVSPAAP
ncbi:MAG: ammonia-forming cytochrome c nitrite reductase subunit c552 [Deltaproteobacteria bacterium]|nr:ammonia-forming cytochrome c nitrite reductase subunit c552 [Deltaproteobacteria bacterium]